MMRHVASSPLLLVVLAVGCLPDPALETPTLFQEVEIIEIANREDGLRGPRDLDFNPDVPGELWVINRTDDAAITIRNVGTSEQTALRRKDPYALHFMEETSSISFSTGMQFGTCGESRNTYDNQAAPNDFMGPALWSATDDVFAISNPEAVDENGFDLGSHLDMMHETPLCMGISWVEANVYFVFEGLTNSIARYDFKEDHGPGFDFHGDGTVERFTDIGVSYVEDIPSHIVFDAETGLLYVADTGNRRVLVVDVSTALQVNEFRGFETMVQESEGATVTTLIGDEFGWDKPSGLALQDGILYVTDAGKADIHAFDLEGNHIDTIGLSLAEDSLMGVKVNPEGDSLYIADFEGDRVFRLQGLAIPE